MQQNREHIQLWQAHLVARQQEHDAKVSQLEGRIARLERAVVEGPGATQIAEAQAEAHHAYRSRDNAWQALCEVRLLHRDAGTGRCRCGKRFDQCPEAQIVDRYPALTKWERAQVERYRNYQPHALPENHPALHNPRWRPD